MQQVDVYGVDSESLEATFEAPADVLRSEIPCPGNHVVPAFGADDDVVTVRALTQEAANQLLTTSGSISIRRIDETHPCIDRRMQGLNAFGIIDGTEKTADGN